MAWWFRKGGLTKQRKKSVPKGVWLQCGECQRALSDPELIENNWVCLACGFHLVMPTTQRIQQVCDHGSFIEQDGDLISLDPLDFVVNDKPYLPKLASSAQRSGFDEAYLSGTAAIGGIPVEVGFFVFEFMGGSMGSVVGEKITRQFERSADTHHPCIIFCASGGARMQEGTLSLMQMAKTSAARRKLRDLGIPYISVLLHPTTGGVAASIATLGDIIVGEANALIGFAGPRVIEQTIGQTLPKGFQRSEYLLEHGIIDILARRSQMKSLLVRSLRWFDKKR